MGWKKESLNKLRSPPLFPDTDEPWPEFVCRLFDTWAKINTEKGQENPVLEVRQALSQKPALEIIALNGTRWVISWAKLRKGLRKLLRFN